ncbi:MAG: AAA family ATPase, partial [Lachnospiraceae bacterium]|nr:AAA family ATPase [Lachnospiraceae bacterium]
MARTVAIGKQDFESVISNDYFYVDKTDFIREWWENGDDVTLITRPRRFGKTLTMNMLECFFSVKYAGKGELFDGLNIWKEEKYRSLQGTYPVISLSFSSVKDGTYEQAKAKIYQIISDLYIQNRFLKNSDAMTSQDIEYFDRVSPNMSETDAAVSLHKLCDFMQRYYGKKAIVLLDEYDTPTQEAYMHGYWPELISFLRNLFHSTFKTNPFLERGIMTGITRVSKESIFSDLNNLTVVTATSNRYADFFGFTQAEVSAALHEFGRSDIEKSVKDWYDGFTFGDKTDIYNPWSIINLLAEGKFDIYWAN